MLRQLPPWHGALVKARDHLRDPAAWKQLNLRAPGRVQGGPGAKCMMLWIGEFAPRDQTWTQEVAHALGFPDYWSATEWNDAEGRTHAEVLERLDRAISGLRNP